jgi:hypothetical protein
MTESIAGDNLTLATSVLCRLRYLYDYGHFQGGLAAGALLAGCDPGIFSFQIDLRGYGVRADGAMRQPVVDLIVRHGFHFPLLFNISDAS